MPFAPYSPPSPPHCAVCVNVGYQTPATTTAREGDRAYLACDEHGPLIEHNGIVAAIRHARSNTTREAV